MYIIKIGNAYVTADGNLTIVQADALKVDIPAGGIAPRLVRFKTRLDRDIARHAAIDGSPTPLSESDYYDDNRF
jgi:hypothetical protein